MCCLSDFWAFSRLTRPKKAQNTPFYISLTIFSSFPSSKIGTPTLSPWISQNSLPFVIANYDLTVFGYFCLFHGPSATDICPATVGHWSTSDQLSSVHFLLVFYQVWGNFWQLWQFFDNFLTTLTTFWQLFSIFFLSLFHSVRQRCNRLLNT
jgi:hypothetical protein